MVRHLQRSMPHLPLHIQRATTTRKLSSRHVSPALVRRYPLSLYPCTLVQTLKEQCRESAILFLQEICVYTL